jgi:invasion protein IalB
MTCAMRRIAIAAMILTAALTAVTPVSAGHAPSDLVLVATTQDETGLSPGRTTPRGPKRSTCDRLKTLVGKLGETYAGHRMRQTWTARICAMTHHAFDDGIWTWPWGAGLSASLTDETNSQAREMPPRLLRTIGAWDIRCGRVGTRQRCAIVRTEMLQPGDAPTAGRIVTHFVIDAVAGREVVLWRVFVERASSDGDAITVPLPGRIARENFDQCSSSGCIMESDVAVSAVVATRLWNGEPSEFRIGTAPEAATVVLPAHGFREALGELTRLRREDRGLTTSGVIP